MKNIHFFFGICALLLISSCGKDYNRGNGATYASMDEVYKMLEVQPKIVTVNGAKGDTFYGSSGTRYIIPPNCLQDASGSAITGDVQVEVAEYLNKGDMVFSKMLPISDGEPLVSGGQIYMYASFGGNPIYLKPGGCVVSATIPKDKFDNKGMDFFAGQINANPADSKVNWQRNDTVPSGAIVYNGDTITIMSDSLHYCNADQYLPKAKDQTFTVTPSAWGIADINSASFIKAFAFFDNYKGVWRIGDVRGKYENGIFSETHVPQIPVHFVVYAMFNGHFYAGIIQATPTTGSNYDVKLVETDPKTFKAQLDNL